MWLHLSLNRRAVEGPPAGWPEGSTPRLLPGLAARANAGEQEDVVGVRGEDRICVEVLLRREAVEVLRAVRRPPRTDHHRDDRQVLQPELLQLGGDRILLLLAER